MDFEGTQHRKKILNSNTSFTGTLGSLNIVTLIHASKFLHLSTLNW